MKIALIKPPQTYADWYKQPLFALTYITSFLEVNGFQCEIFDAHFHSWGEKQLLCNVQKYNPDIIGITAMTHEIIRAAQIADKLKAILRIPIIIGGCHVSALPKRTLEEFPVFDYAIYGEGERTILELLQHLQQGNNFYLSTIKGIKGLAFRRGGEIFINESRSLLSSLELDLLPYPACEHYYGKNSRALARKESEYCMLATRGCPYNCAFCMQMLGRKIRRRSAQNICDEIEFAISTYGAHTIDFTDEILLYDCRETRELFELMIKKGISRRIRWSGHARANLVNAELIDMAKKAGCYRLGMGIESGDDNILKAVNKCITVEQVRRAVKIIKDAGIKLGTYYILGHPNETRESIEKTVELAAELNTETIAVGLMVPYPGTRIYDMALHEQGGYRLLTQDWAEYDKYCSQALSFKNLSYNELIKWRQRAFIMLYLKNFRIIDMVKFLWKRRNAFRFLIAKQLKNFAKIFSKDNRGIH